MPTYEYKCAQCGHSFEEFQSISAQALVRCPRCHQGSLKRVLGGGAGMIFKGQGFYLTDYKKGGDKTKAGKNETVNKADTGTGPGTKSNSDTSKPAAESPGRKES
jgi:putative FmdB family regulatory protein